MKLARVISALVTVLLLTGMVAKSEPSLTVSSTNAIAGSTATVAVNLITDGTITGVNFDLLFDTNSLESGTPFVGNAIPNPFFGFNLISPGDLRVLSIAFPTAPASNGVVAFIPFTALPTARDGAVTLTLTNLAATDATGVAVAITNSNGRFTVIVTPRVALALPKGGVPQLSVIGRTNLNYLIQATTNLATPQWISFTNILSGSNLFFDDITASNFPIRFYRALIVP